MKPHDVITENESVISILHWNGLTFGDKRFFCSTVDKQARRCTVEVLCPRKRVIRSLSFDIIPLPPEKGRFRFMADTENCEIDALNAYTFKLDLQKIGLIPTGIFTQVRCFEPADDDEEESNMEEAQDCEKETQDNKEDSHDSEE